MSPTRRDFLQQAAAVGVTLAGTAALPGRLFGASRRPAPIAELPDPSVMKQLAWRAVEAAGAAGAAYADARLSHTQGRNFDGGHGHLVVGEAEALAVGVRALVDGYWGFAAGPYWTPDEMDRLARDAVAQAKANAVGRSRRVDLGTPPTVRDGRWVMPVKTDPFTVPVEEVRDTLGSLQLFMEHATPVRATRVACQFQRQERVFASTDGASWSQRTYRGFGEVRIAYRGQQTWIDFLGPEGRGWEVLGDNQGRIRTAIPELMAEIDADLALPVKPVEVGRYDVLFDASSMALLLAETLGPATELDRALGYEANAGGTSYLNDPFAMLGSYQAGSPLVTVRANRSVEGGLATVRWDDEGVEPDEFELVKDGVLSDFQTTRESAAWLAEAYAKRGQPVRSHGCAAADTAFDVALQRTPNIALAPGREALSLDDLVAGTKQGVAVKRLRTYMDFQHLNGLGRGAMYEIKNGKRVARLEGAGVLFRAPELWRGVYALGGDAALRWYPTDGSTKGEPAQSSEYTVGAVPGAIKQLTVIEATRKA